MVVYGEVRVRKCVDVNGKFENDRLKSIIEIMHAYSIHPKTNRIRALEIPYITEKLRSFLFRAKHPKFEVREPQFGPGCIPRGHLYVIIRRFFTFVRVEIKTTEFVDLQSKLEEIHFLLHRPKR